MNYTAVVLWLLWIEIAGGTVAGKAYRFPSGCAYGNCRLLSSLTQDSRKLTILQLQRQIRFVMKITVVEAFAFVNIFCGTLPTAARPTY